ncbi:MAG: NADH-quinone oxidoreductase subunit C [Bacteroidia bacterium]|nr:NADH-quinone oxidoreductase subunit C [Bacteroidia bacterium]
MIEITNAYLLKELQEHFAAFIISDEEPFGMLTIVLDKDKIIPVLEYLNLHPHISMQFLTTLCGIHFPENKGKELGVIYHMHSLVNNVRLRIKCFTDITNPVIPSVTSIYQSANWQERETYDFYGIIFEGHPNLIRILNVDEMDYFPMRKEYPLEDQTRTDKEDTFFGR